GRPSALTVICVLAIVFGVLGLLTGGIGLVSQIFSSTVEKAITAAQGGANSPGGEVQKEMMTRTLEITRKYNLVMIPLMVLKVLVEAALLAGAIMALGLKPSGRSWLLGALAAAIILESIQAVPTFLIQRETQAITAEMMPRIMAANGAPPGDGMSSVMSGIGTVSLIFGLVWLVIKIVLCALGIRYLRKPDIEALFTPEAT